MIQSFHFSWTSSICRVNREFSVVVKFFIAYSSQHVCLFVCLFVWRPSTACRDRRRLSFVFHYVCSLAEQFTHVVTATSEAIRAIWKTFDQQKHCLQFVLLENEAAVSLQSPHWMFAWSLRLRSCSTRHSASHALSLQFRLRLLV